MAKMQMFKIGYDKGMDLELVVQACKVDTQEAQAAKAERVCDQPGLCG